MRSLILALLILALASPAAHAYNGLPIYAATDGVHIVRGGSGRSDALRFSAKADKLYRSIRGRRAAITCIGINNGDDANLDSASGSGIVPRKRGRLYLGSRGMDVCAILTPRGINDDCVEARRYRDQCPRVIVAMNDAGRTYLDHVERTAELSYISDLSYALPRDWAPTVGELLNGTIESEVVMLDGPDASPPAGKVGYWEQGATHVVVVLLKDGRRRFLRHDSDVVSTNEPRLLAGEPTIF